MSPFPSRAPFSSAARSSCATGAWIRHPRTRTLACVALLAAASLWLPGRTWAAGFSSVSGTVFGPQHRPVAGAEVRLQSTPAAYSLTTNTNAQGRYTFPTVPLGTYTVTATRTGLHGNPQTVSVLSGYAPAADFQLSSALQVVTVTAQRIVVPNSVTPTTLVSTIDIARTPGAALTNSQALITDFVPGAYVVHDMLHVRGGHQTGWYMDGVEIPNTNIASNLGPQLDPRDIDELAAERGSYGADLGDRTYGIFNVVPKSGLGLKNQGEVIVSGGNYDQTDDYMSFGSHSGPFAYYASLDANRSNLGLQTPTALDLHDREDGYGLFANLDYSPGTDDQYRFVTGSRHDDYQIPNAPGQVLNDVERESDSFGILSWLHTFNSETVLQTSAFYHYNTANYDGAANDFPLSTTDQHASTYVGGQEELRYTSSRNNVSVGLYTFGQRDSQYFHVLFNDGSGVPISETLSPSGNLVAVWAQDDYRASNSVHFQAGVRQTFFSGVVTESATSPRLGMTVQLPHLNWVLRGFWGKYYQAPPLETLSGPILAYAESSDLAFRPLPGERDTEYQYGITIPLDGWLIDADHFRTDSTNFLDHNPIGESEVFFPITITGALIRGYELTVRSPPVWQLGQFHLSYSNQIALGFGAITGGLQDFSPPAGYYFLDHDQRNTLNTGFDANLPDQSFASIDLYYGSGFSNGVGPSSHLPSNYALNLSVGKTFGQSLTASVDALNVTNQHLLTDNSLTFGGFHYNEPFEIYAEIRYRFHY